MRTFCYAILLLLPLSLSLRAQEVKALDVIGHGLTRAPWQHLAHLGEKPMPRPTADDMAQAQAAAQHGTLRSTLLRTDVLEYYIWQSIAYEVRIENIGTKPIRIPIGRDRGLLQPKGNVAPFNYWQMTLSLDAIMPPNPEAAALVSPVPTPIPSIPPTGRWAAMLDFQLFYGSDARPETMITLKPGEWLTVRAKGQIQPQPRPIEDQLSDINAVNVDVQMFSNHVNPTTGAEAGWSGWVQDEKGADRPVRIMPQVINHN